MGSYWVAHKVQSGISVYSGHIVVSLPGCTQLLSMFVWEKKCFDHHWVAGWDFFFSFVLVMCPSLGWVILYWLDVSTFNALWVVRHQATYYCALVSIWFPVLIRAPRRSFLPTGGRVHKNSNGFVTKKRERTCGLRERGNTCSVALFHVRSSLGIPNVAARRDYFNRRLLSRIQTMSNSFPRWLLNKYKREGEGGMKEIYNE